MTTRRDEISRLRKVARQALADYGMQEAECHLLLHGMNTTFKVTTGPGFPSSPFIANRYVLRIHPPNWFTPEVVEAEMLYLLELRTKLQLPVSEPIPATNGEWVRQIMDDTGNSHCCVLLKWVDGAFRSKKLHPSALTNVGRLIGNLHEVSPAFTNLTRPRFDWDGFFGPTGLFNPKEHCASFTPEETEIINRAGEHIQRKLGEIPMQSDTFGMIHGDIYHRNLLVKHGEVRVIDFDLCGYGYFLYDLAIPYWPDRQGDISAAMECVLRGYREIRNLPAEYERYLGVFFAIRRLIDANYMVVRRNHPDIGGYASHIISWAVSELKKYLAT